MNIKSSQTLVAEALSEIKTISTDEAHKMSNEDKCNLIDIRDIRELEKEGRVENSNHISELKDRRYFVKPSAVKRAKKNDIEFKRKVEKILEEERRLKAKSRML